MSSLVRINRPARLPEPSSMGMRSVNDMANEVFRFTEAPWVTTWRIEAGKVGVRLPDPPDGLRDHLQGLSTVGVVVHAEAA